MPLAQPRIFRGASLTCESVGRVNAITVADDDFALRTLSARSARTFNTTAASGAARFNSASARATGDNSRLDATGDPGAYRALALLT
jgi:hypothetical protein